MDVRVHVEDRNQFTNQSINQDATGYRTGQTPPPFMSSPARASINTHGNHHESLVSSSYDPSFPWQPEESPETAVEAQRRAIIMDPASYAALGDFHLNLARTTVTPTAALMSPANNHHHEHSHSGNSQHHQPSTPDRINNQSGQGIQPQHHLHQPQLTPTQQHLHMAKGYYEEAQRASTHKHGHIHPTTLSFGVKISEITSLEQLHVSQYYYEELLKSSIDELGPEHPTVMDYARRLLEINESIGHMSNDGSDTHNVRDYNSNGSNSSSNSINNNSSNNSNSNNNDIEGVSNEESSTLLSVSNETRNRTRNRDRTSSQSLFPSNSPT